VLTKVVQEQQKMLKEQQATMQQRQDKLVSLENALQLKRTRIPTWHKRTPVTVRQNFN